MIKFKYRNKIHNFFHIPKTGGTSMSYALRNNFEVDFLWEKYKHEFEIGSQHLSYNYYRQYVNASDINLAVIRDPIERLNSLYKNFLAKDTKKYNNFTEWFYSIKKDYPHILLSQKHMLSGGIYNLYYFHNLNLLAEYLDIQLPYKNIITLETNITTSEKNFIKDYYSEDYQLLEYIIPLKQVYEFSV